MRELKGCIPFGVRRIKCSRMGNDMTAKPNTYKGVRKLIGLSPARQWHPTSIAAVPRCDRAADVLE